VSFFYSSGAGVIDFAVLIAVCGAGLAFGSQHMKAFAWATLTVFLAGRLFLATLPHDGVMAAQCVVELGALMVLVQSVKTIAGRAFAALYAVDMLAYALVISGLISFHTMATVSTVVLYGQLLLILGGVARDGFMAFSGGPVRPHNHLSAVRSAPPRRQVALHNGRTP
jgi:hypothetical protein